MPVDPILDLSDLRPEHVIPDEVITLIDVGPRRRYWYEELPRCCPEHHNLDANQSTPCTTMWVDPEVWVRMARDKFLDEGNTLDDFLLLALRVQQSIDDDDLELIDWAMNKFDWGSAELYLYQLGCDEFDVMDELWQMLEDEHGWETARLEDDNQFCLVGHSRMMLLGDSEPRQRPLRIYSLPPEQSRTEDLPDEEF